MKNLIRVTVMLLVVVMMLLGIFLTGYSFINDDFQLAETTKFGLTILGIAVLTAVLFLKEDKL
jgi:hypothetical protein